MASWSATVETTCKSGDKKETQGVGDTKQKAIDQAKYAGAAYCVSRRGVKSQVVQSTTQLE